jgi:hypothetical protein
MIVILSHTILVMLKASWVCNRKFRFFPITSKTVIISSDGKLSHFVDLSAIISLPPNTNNLITIKLGLGLTILILVFTNIYNAYTFDGCSG